MNEQAHPGSGTVAEEAARLIDALAAMARSSTGPSPDPSPYAGGPAPEAGSTGERKATRPSVTPDGASERVCSSCGGEREGPPVACRLCPLCQGIALLRSVRPETVDRLADFASALAAGLRDVATQARASARASAATPASGRPPEGGRATVQDIPVDDVDDEDEG